MRLCALYFLWFSLIWLRVIDDVSQLDIYWDIFIFISFLSTLPTKFATAYLSFNTKRSWICILPFGDISGHKLLYLLAISPQAYLQGFMQFLSFLLPVYNDILLILFWLKRFRSRSRGFDLARMLWFSLCAMNAFAQSKSIYRLSSRRRQPRWCHFTSTKPRQLLFSPCCRRFIWYFIAAIRWAFWGWRHISKKLLHAHAVMHLASPIFTGRSARQASRPPVAKANVSAYYFTSRITVVLKIYWVFRSPANKKAVALKTYFFSLP